MKDMKNILKRLIACIISPSLSHFIVRGFYDSIWELRDSILRTPRGVKYSIKSNIYFSYLERYGCWIGLGAEFNGIPILPHGFFGFFISNNAKIGKDVVIFQHVTIGSNTLKDSGRKGSPVICDKCYIGAGAKIIGKVVVGENSRIGANAIVVKDVPANSTTIIRGIETIVSERVFDNEFVPVK